MAGNISNKAGIVLQLDNLILLVKKANKEGRAFSIPSGKLKYGESELNGAVREFIEETGLFFITNLINKNIETHQINLYDSNNLSGILTYFVIKIDSLNDIGLDDYIVSKDILNPNEISWAGFVDIQVAYQYLEYGQLIILDRLDK